MRSEERVLVCLTVWEIGMYELIKLEESDGEVTMDVMDLGSISEETKGSFSGPWTESTTLPFRKT